MLGSLVLVKLHPYHQTMVARWLNNKLYRWYFGPYPILDVVGPVGYKWQLPTSSKIHPTFHVMLLKYKGEPPSEVHALPPSSLDNRLVLLFLVIVASRIVLKHGGPMNQILVQWTDSQPGESSWENYKAFCHLYNGLNLKVNFDREVMKWRPKLKWLRWKPKR